MSYYLSGDDRQQIGNDKTEEFKEDTNNTVSATVESDEEEDTPSPEVEESTNNEEP